MASLKQIAGDLGVSHALVSRVLNNRMGTTRVSEKTRAAILLRAKELEYQPNPLALALKQGRTGVVGVFLHGVGVDGSELSTSFIKAASNSLSELGQNLWLQFFESNKEFHHACNEKLIRKVDGLILAGLSHPDLLRNLASLEKQGLAVASACFFYHEDFGVTNFVVDQQMQCYLTTKHLLEIGCRRIAHFYTSPIHYMGYLHAHTEEGVSPVKRLTIPTARYTAEDGRDSMKQLLATKEPFDGVCTHSDAQAVGALQHLVNIGMPRKSWPKITGVDDSPIARDYGPIPITSVTAEMAECARKAVAAIALKMQGQTVPSEKIKPRLVVRQSTVP